MSNPPSEDIKDILVTAGLGTFEATSGWSINIAKEPNSPNQAITLYDKGGASPNPKFLLDEPTVRIRVRGRPGRYKGAHIKATAIKDALLGYTPQTVNGTAYCGIMMLGDINFIGFDDLIRPLFTTTWRVIREPSSGTYRTAI